MLINIIVFWIVITLLLIFLIIDTNIAFRAFQMTGNLPELIIHCLLLSILALLIIYMLIAVLNAGNLIIDIFGV